MKRYIIKNAQGIDVDDSTDELYAITYNGIATGDEKMTVSDGYHTMDELYDHRIALFIALCKKIADLAIPTEKASIRQYPRQVWKSKKHSDGTSYDGWFILGINTAPGEQITYHLPMDQWEKTSFAKERETAPEFDGHSSNDVLQRIQNI